MVKLGAEITQVESRLSAGKKTLAILSLTIAVAILALTPQSTYAQFIPCRVVTLNLVPPPLVQAGQLFQITTNLTVSCDPSVLPVIRVDLLDATTSQTLSTNSVPYYPFSSSFTASVVNQVTARQFTGSWALQVQAYVISGLNGQTVASTAQLFQVNVEPYIPPVTEMQTTATTQVSNPSFAVTTQLLPATTALGNITETTTSSQLAVNNQPTSTSFGQLLVPVMILLVGLAAFGLLIFAGNRRKRPSTSNTLWATWGRVKS